MRKANNNIALVSYSDLMGISDERTGNGTNSEQPGVEAEKEKVVLVPLEQMHEFNGHPFSVLEDARMAETVESIRKYGVLMPGILRPRTEGGYEIIAGHRRKRASELAGKKDMPVIIKELSDEEATILMVDSNIQREDILPSEKAIAYRMKYEALKKLGSQENGRNDEVLAEQMGESRNTIQRYIRLTYLIRELLDMVDTRKLGITIAVDLSYLQKREQEMLVRVMEAAKVVPNGVQAQTLKEYSKKKELNEAVMELVLARSRPDPKVSFSSNELIKYFPEDYTPKQMEEIIYQLLEEWIKNNGV